MKVTPNYTLPQFEDNDLFDKGILNDGFNKLDRAISDIQETFNNTASDGALVVAEVIGARGGEKDLETRLNNHSSQLETNHNKTKGVLAVESYKNDYAIKDANGNVIDWSPAINKAISDAGSDSEIMLPNGDAPFSETILLNKRVKLIGYGMGETNGELKAGTLLIKTKNIVGLSIRCRYTTLDGFSMTSIASDDVLTGIEIGGDTDSYSTDSGTSSTIQNVSVFEQGGDGIWIKNADGCKIEVISKRNKGHGVRLESTNTSGDNVNANIIDIKQATGNYKSGLFLNRAHCNIINFCAEGNHEYGLDINSTGNYIKGYTEGNVLGSSIFRTSSNRNEVNVRFNEGSPTYQNHGNYVTEQLLTTTKIKNYGVGRYYLGITSNRIQLVYPIIEAGGYADQTIPNLYSAVVGDPVYVCPDGAINVGLSFYAWVSANNTVTVRLTNHTNAPITPYAKIWRAEMVLRNGIW